MSSLSINDSSSQNEDWDRSLIISDVESLSPSLARQISKSTPRNSIIFPVDSDATPGRTRANTVDSPARDGNRSLSELMKLHAEKGTDVRFSAEEASRLADVLGQWVDNKWKWSRTHTWQSWRDHYYKNHGYYDSEIRKYQRKHNLDPADKRDDDDGNANEDRSTQTKRKRGPEKEEKRVKVKREPGSNQATRVSRRKETDEVLIMGKGKARMNDAEDRYESQNHTMKESLADSEFTQAGVAAGSPKVLPG
ncbi:hypothetical protein C0991_002785, partial [Blastosporella zonata]